MARALVALCLVAAVAVGSAGPASAAVVTVSQCDEATLRAAITSAAPGDTVDFSCDGTITLTEAGGGQILIDKALTIDGTGHDVTISGGGEVHMFRLIGGLSIPVTFRHLNLVDGKTLDAEFSSNGGGGAILNFAALTVDDVHFEGNRAFDVGGAILTRGQLTVTDSSFVDNGVTTAVGFGTGGGAIAIGTGGFERGAAGVTTITNSTFEDNFARGQGQGGAVHAPLVTTASNAQPINIIDSTFTGNTSVPTVPPNNTQVNLTGGGAVSVINHALTIDGSTFESNTTTGFVVDGGAVLIQGAENPALSLPPLAISDSTFTANTALPGSSGVVGFGGGVSVVKTSSATVSGSTFTANVASTGGAVAARSDTQVTDAAITDNVAQSPGAPGGLYTLADATVSLSEVLDNLPFNCGTVFNGRVLDNGGNTEGPGTTCFSPNITTDALPDWTADHAGYDQRVIATGVTPVHTFAVSAGALPPGLTLAPGGVISGTPTTTGQFDFTVTVTDAENDTDAQAFSVTINEAITLPPSSPGDWTVDTPGYSATFDADGGTGATTFAVTDGELPPGLELDPSGALAGTPTTAGPFSFTITATDSVGATDTETYSVTINDPLTVPPAPLPDGMVGEAGYTVAISAHGGTAPTSFAVTAGSLPPGLTFDGASGELTGTPTVAGTFTFTITATDSAGASASRPFSVTIRPAGGSAPSAPPVAGTPSFTG